MKYPIPFFLFAILMILLSTNCDQGSSACPSNASRDVDGECVCNEGFVEDSEGDCVPIDCPENSTLNPATKECECMEGYIKTTDGTCIPDPGVNCPENSTYNASTQACECNEGFELNEDGECVEKVDCPPNSSYSEATDACECDEGYEEDYYGDCIKKEEEEDCPENATYIEAEDRCQCNSGYYPSTDGESCVIFQADSWYGIYEVSQSCSGSGGDTYFINVEELPNQPDFVSIVGLFGFIEFTTLRLNETRTGAVFQDGEIIGGKPASGEISWDLLPDGTITNLLLDATYDGESCTGTFDVVEENENPCPDNATFSNLKCVCDAGYREVPATGDCAAWNPYGDYDLDQSCSGLGDSDYMVRIGQDTYQGDPNFILIQNLFESNQGVRCELNDELTGATVAPNQYIFSGQHSEQLLVTGEIRWGLREDGTFQDVAFTYQTDTGDACTADLTPQ
ncbi:MAG: hypothetical protein AAFW73_05030 [Bacteroidota bacterium]